MRNKNLSMKVRVLFAAMLLLITTVETFASRDRTRRIRFESGRTTKVIKDAVVRGDRDRYILHARAGQTLLVHITSEENNAVFDIYRPGGKHTLENAQESTDWSGALTDTSASTNWMIASRA